MGDTFRRASPRGAEAQVATARAWTRRKNEKTPTTPKRTPDVRPTRARTDALAALACWRHGVRDRRDKERVYCFLRTYASWDARGPARWMRSRPVRTADGDSSGQATTGHKSRRRDDTNGGARKTARPRRRRTKWRSGNGMCPCTLAGGRGRRNRDSMAVRRSELLRAAAGRCLGLARARQCYRWPGLKLHGAASSRSAAIARLSLSPDNIFPVVRNKKKKKLNFLISDWINHAMTTRWRAPRDGNAPSPESRVMCRKEFKNVGVVAAAAVPELLAWYWYRTEQADRLS